MIIIPFKPNAEPWHAHRRRCAFAPASLHVYRRSLVRRFGLPEAGRPAAALNKLARAMLSARVG